MSSSGDSRPRTASDLSPLTLGLASLGSVVATVMVSRFGLAGTVAGAALAPVVIAIVRELGRKPVESVVRLPSGARAVVERRPRVRLAVVALTAVAAFAVAVAAFTIPDMLAGSSVVSERPTTFFSPGDGSGGGATAAPEDADEEPATTTAAPEGTVTAPAPEVTAPPAETAPAPPPPDPGTMAPAPPAAPGVVPPAATTPAQPSG